MRKKRQIADQLGLISARLQRNFAGYLCISPTGIVVFEIDWVRITGSKCNKDWFEIWSQCFNNRGTYDETSS